MSVFVGVRSIDRFVLAILPAVTAPAGISAFVLTMADWAFATMDPTEASFPPTLSMWVSSMVVETRIQLSFLASEAFVDSLKETDMLIAFA